MGVIGEKHDYNRMRECPGPDGTHGWADGKRRVKNKGGFKDAY